MRGGQDLGGRQGLGPIDPESEANEPIFHDDWERRVFALTLATGMLGRWNIDESRYARESQHPADYLQHSYYENWLAGLETLLQAKGLVMPEELAGLPALTRRPATADALAPSNQSTQKLRVPNREAAMSILASGGPTDMPADSAPRFAIGDVVRVRRWQSSGHCRAPDYVQGCTGTIAELRGHHVYPDDNARGQRQGQPLYSVCFSAHELWGNALAADLVYVDLWEPYLDAC